MSKPSKPDVQILPKQHTHLLASLEQTLVLPPGVWGLLGGRRGGGGGVGCVFRDSSKNGKGFKLECKLSSNDK